MLRDGRVCGAIVVQSYEQAARYGEAERALLGFVAQHVQTAMDRRQAQVRLEQQVARRTQELQRANRSLQDEVAERRRAEQLQTALYNIAEMAMSADSLDQFYGQVHGVVGRLLDARNSTSPWSTRPATAWTSCIRWMSTMPAARHGRSAGA